MMRVIVQDGTEAMPEQSLPDLMEDRRPIVVFPKYDVAVVGRGGSHHREVIDYARRAGAITSNEGMEGRHVYGEIRTETRIFQWFEIGDSLQLADLPEVEKAVLEALGLDRNEDFKFGAASPQVNVFLVPTDEKYYELNGEHGTGDYPLIIQSIGDQVNDYDFVPERINVWVGPEDSYHYDMVMAATDAGMKPEFNQDFDYQMSNQKLDLDVRAEFFGEDPEPWRGKKAYLTMARLNEETGLVSAGYGGFDSETPLTDEEDAMIAEAVWLELGQQPNDFKFARGDNIEIIDLTQEENLYGRHDPDHLPDYTPEWPIVVVPIGHRWEGDLEYKVFVGRENGFHAEIQQNPAFQQIAERMDEGSVLAQARYGEGQQLFLEGDVDEGVRSAIEDKLDAFLGFDPTQFKFGADENLKVIYGSFSDTYPGMLNDRVPIIYDFDEHTLYVGNPGNYHQHLFEEFPHLREYFLSAKGQIAYGQINRWNEQEWFGQEPPADVQGYVHKININWPPEIPDGDDQLDFKFGFVNVIDHRDATTTDRPSYLGDSHREFVQDRTDDNALFLQYPITAWWDDEQGWSIAIGPNDGFHRDMSTDDDEMAINGRFTPPNNLAFYSEDPEFEPLVPAEIQEEMIAALNQLLGGEKDFRFGAIPDDDDRPIFADQLKMWVESFPAEDHAHEKNLSLDKASSWFRRRLNNFRRRADEVMVEQGKISEDQPQCTECGFSHKPGTCPKSKGGPMIMPPEPESSSLGAEDFNFDDGDQKVSSEGLLPVWVNEDSRVVGSGKGKFDIHTEGGSEFDGHSMYVLPSLGQIWVGTSSYVHHFQIQRALNDADIHDPAYPMWTMFDRLILDSPDDNPEIDSSIQTDLLGLAPAISDALGLPVLPPRQYADGEILTYNDSSDPGMLEQEDFKFGSIVGRVKDYFGIGQGVWRRQSNGEIIVHDLRNLPEGPYPSHQDYIQAEFPYLRPDDTLNRQYPVIAWEQDDVWHIALGRDDGFHSEMQDDVEQFFGMSYGDAYDRMQVPPADGRFSPPDDLVFHSYYGVPNWAVARMVAALRDYFPEEDSFKFGYNEEGNPQEEGSAMPDITVDALPPGELFQKALENNPDLAHNTGDHPVVIYQNRNTREIVCWVGPHDGFHQDMADRIPGYNEDRGRPYVSGDWREQGWWVINDRWNENWGFAGGAGMRHNVDQVKNPSGAAYGALTDEELAELDSKIRAAVGVDPAADDFKFGNILHAEQGGLMSARLDDAS